MSCAICAHTRTCHTHARKFPPPPPMIAMMTTMITQNLQWQGVGRLVLLPIYWFSFFNLGIGLHVSLTWKNGRFHAYYLCAVVCYSYVFVCCSYVLVCIRILPVVLVWWFSHDPKGAPFLKITLIVQPITTYGHEIIVSGQSFSTWDKICEKNYINRF